MKTRVSQLMVQSLLFIVITAIVIYTCMNLMVFIDKFVGRAEDVLTSLNFGF